MLCVLAASAVSYGTFYKGTPQYGVIYTTSSAEATTIGTGEGMYPFASYGGGNNTLRKNNGGIHTSAEFVQGGVTTLPARTSLKGTKGITPPGSPPDCGCDWQWVPEQAAFVCTKCKAVYTEDDYYDGKAPHGGGDCPCHVPIGDGWPVWLFMIAMAMAYMVFKNGKSTVLRRP